MKSLRVFLIQGDTAKAKEHGDNFVERAKRRRKIVRRDNGKVVEYEEVRYGMLMMVLCDREGRVYDVWITFGSVHEVRAF